MNISELAKDESAKQFAVIHAGEYADDIFQDALLAMLELPESKVKQIEKDNAIPYYFRQVIYNMSKAMFRNNRVADSSTCSLSLIESSLSTECDTFDFEHDGNDIESMISDDYKNAKLPKRIVDKLNEMRFYDREIFLLYSELGSFRKVEKQTGINYVAIHRTVKKVQDELRPIFNSNM